jgi:hypothetical protein
VKHCATLSGPALQHRIMAAIKAARTRQRQQMNTKTVANAQVKPNRHLRPSSPVMLNVKPRGTMPGSLFSTARAVATGATAGQRPLAWDETSG